MVDALLHVLDQVGPARVSVWTWAIAEFEVDSMRRLARDGRLIGETLLVMDGRRTRMTGYSQAIEAEWRQSFGPNSIRLCHNHAKVATVEGLPTADGPGLRVLLRGSMNLNQNPRFEQLDVSEGGPAFDLVRQIEAELPVLSAPSNADLTAATRLDEAHGPETLELFGLGGASRFGGGIKTWGK